METSKSIGPGTTIENRPPLLLLAFGQFQNQNEEFESLRKNVFDLTDRLSVICSRMEPNTHPLANTEAANVTGEDPSKQPKPEHSGAIGEFNGHLSEYRKNIILLQNQLSDVRRLLDHLDTIV